MRKSGTIHIVPPIAVESFTTRTDSLLLESIPLVIGLCQFVNLAALASKIGVSGYLYLILGRYGTGDTTEKEILRTALYIYL